MLVKLQKLSLLRKSVLWKRSIPYATRARGATTTMIIYHTALLTIFDVEIQSLLGPRYSVLLTSIQVSGNGLKLSVWQDTPEELCILPLFYQSIDLCDISKVSAGRTGDFTS